MVTIMMDVQGNGKDSYFSQLQAMMNVSGLCPFDSAGSSGSTLGIGLAKACDEADMRVLLMMYPKTL